MGREQKEKNEISPKIIAEIVVYNLKIPVFIPYRFFVFW